MKKLDKLVEIVGFNAGGALSTCTVKKLHKGADVYDAIELADRDYPCSVGERWDTHFLDFDRHGFLILFR